MHPLNINIIKKWKSPFPDQNAEPQMKKMAPIHETYSLTSN